MPWTFSHPAAVLPFRRMAALLRLPLLGLVLGSIAPDLPYYVGRYDLASFAHSVTGALLVCAPLSALLAVCVIRWRTVLTAPLPQPHRGAIQGLEAPPAGSVASVIALGAAAFVGALTHITWDSFTHASGEAVKALPLLQAQIGQFGGRTMRAYGALQHASTVVGALLLLLAYRKWLASTRMAAITEPSRRRVVLLTGCVLGSTALGMSVALATARTAGSVSALVVQGVIHATTMFTLAYLVLAAYWSRATGVLDPGSSPG
jgi:hypothetical protein